MWCLLLTFPELLVGGGLLVPCSLPGPPVIKQLMQMVTMAPGQDGRFQSVCFPITVVCLLLETLALWCHQIHTSLGVMAVMALLQALDFA